MAPRGEALQRLGHGVSAGPNTLSAGVVKVPTQTQVGGLVAAPHLRLKRVRTPLRRLFVDLNVLKSHAGCLYLPWAGICC